MTLPAPYFQDESVTLYCGDCREILPLIATASVDVVFTSPPYNRGDMSGGLANIEGGYRSYADNLPHADYVRWQQETLTECWRLLSERGAIFYNHAPRIQDGVVWLPLELNPGLPLRQIVIWDQVVGINWSPRFYLPLHEWLMVLARPGFELTSRSASNVGDVWRIRVEVPSTGRPDHPAAFPIKLPMRALASIKPGVVLDPFAGSGTTIRAAKNLGWQAIGIEIEEKYCEIAVRRLAQSVLPFAVEASA